MISPDTASPEEDTDTLSNAERKAVSEADEWLKAQPADPPQGSARGVRPDHGRLGKDGTEAPTPYREKRPGAMAKRIVWTDQAKDDVRAIAALQILKTLARYVQTGEATPSSFGTSSRRCFAYALRITAFSSATKATI